jgi:hypothetical protein
MVALRWAAKFIKYLRNAGQGFLRISSCRLKRGQVDKDVSDVRCFDDFEHWT